MDLMIKLTQEELNDLQYSVIVEMYSKLVGTKKIKYREEFTERERQIIQSYYKKFCQWHLVTGTPEHGFVMKPNTINLIKRAVHFMATM